MVEPNCARFGKAEVDLFTPNTTPTARYGYLSLSLSPIGVDMLRIMLWLRKLIYAFPPLSFIPPLLERVKLEQLLVIPGALDRLSGMQR